MEYRGQSCADCNDGYALGRRHLPLFRQEPFRDSGGDGQAYDDGDAYENEQEIILGLIPQFGHF